jgi:serine/threonine protein kinase
MVWPHDDPSGELEQQALDELRKVATTRIDDARVRRWLADDDYSVTTYDEAGVGRTTTRKGPWAMDAPIAYPTASNHRTVRVLRAPMSPRLAVQIVVDAGRAMEHVHAAGLGHGMLTTEALSLAPDGSVGVARVGTWGCRHRAIIHSGSGHRGRYFADLAPESLDAEHLPRAPTTASDLFQLASALYELLAFSPPWRRATYADDLEALRHDTLAPISTIAPAAAPLDALLARALARDPKARPPFAEWIASLADLSWADDGDSLARVMADARDAPDAASAPDVPM